MDNTGMKIIVLEGDMAGQEFPLSYDFTSIGRGEGVDVQLPADNSISRRHAVIRREYGRFILEDLGSTNGTFVFKENNEEEEVIHAVLTDNARFRVGKTLLRLVRSDVEIGLEPNQFDTLEVVADTPADYAIRSSFDPEMIYQTNFLQLPEDSKSAEELNHKIKVFYAFCVSTRSIKLYLDTGIRIHPRGKFFSPNCKFPEFIKRTLGIGYSPQEQQKQKYKKNDNTAP